MYIKKEPKTLAENLMQKLYDGEVSGMYMGGSLEIDKYLFNSDSYEPIEGMFDRDEEEAQPYNTREQYLWSKLYLKHKTPSHHYYTKSEKIVASYEGK